MTVCHIHLDAVGVPHDSNGAPFAWFHATKRVPMPSIQVNVSRSITGRTYVSRVIRSDNARPVVHRDWRYMLRVSQEELDYLVYTLLGRECEFIDHRHPATGISHASYIQNVVLKDVSGIDNLDPMLTKYDVAIELVSIANTLEVGS